MIHINNKMYKVPRNLLIIGSDKLPGRKYNILLKYILENEYL